MQQNINPCVSQTPYRQVPVSGPNAVNINIFQPQAYGSNNDTNTQGQNFYPLYQTNQNPALPLYPMNYNNMIQYPNLPQQYHQGYMPQQSPYAANPYAGNSQTVTPYATNPYNMNNQQQQGNNGVAPNTGNNTGNNSNAYNETNLIEKTKNDSSSAPEAAKETKKKDEKEKTITILTDDYIKTLENYLNDANPKVRLIAAKEVLERFKEDDSRTTNPSLNALLNKILRDTSPSVRFLGLTTLQLGYSVGNDETVGILKEIQETNQDKLGQDSLLASEILLKMSAPRIKEVK